MDRTTPSNPHGSTHSGKAGTDATQDLAKMLACYDVWSATPDNLCLCEDVYPRHETAVDGD